MCTAICDLFVFVCVVGTQQLPPLFSLGYHQCRWNYRDERDVSSVESMFEELDYPYDVLWLDIEHTNGKRYFTWDKNVFPTPLEMQRNISAHGRKMVTIVDPHIKRDNGYAIHTEATEKGLYIKNHQGKDFDGWCWPGQSSYLDFTDARVREWWAGRFALDKYEGSTLDLFTWNDMNEPSVFNGPEVSMQKDCRNLQDIEHRYSLLPYWYSSFYTSYRTGIPVMRPMFSEFPDSEVVFNMDDQWMVGS
ncbi:modA, partial [Symbiodinium microadriaticum]